MVDKFSKYSLKGLTSLSGLSTKVAIKTQAKSATKSNLKICKLVFYALLTFFLVLTLTQNYLKIKFRQGGSFIDKNNI